MGHDKSQEKGFICTATHAGSQKKHTQKEDFSKVNTLLNHLFTYNKEYFWQAESRKEVFGGRKSGSVSHQHLDAL